MFEDGTELPKELEARFEVISMLKQDGEGTLTCLAASRENGEKVLLKVACEASDAVQLRNEKELLEKIGGREGFPEVIGAGTEPTAWLARTWVEGRTVESMVESRTKAPGVSREQALDCAIAVAEKLAFLHGMNPPIIHRDVKPQNVVMDGEGKYHLIDMGISRTFREGSRMDTQISGTRATAPPEQYGYRQTDVRSDVFSLGVLLRYAMTGEYAEDADVQLPRDVRAIVEKATRFDPEQRYQSAREMLGALVAARFGGELQPGRKKGRAVVWALCAGLVFCLLLLAFTIPAAWRQDVFRGLEARLGTAYTFRDPLIEEAVRQELAKPEGEITYADLEQVTAIHIYGKQIYKNEDSFWFRAQYDYCRDEAMRESGLYLENGGIRSLEDVLRMPNLRELSLYNQEISDLSALKDTKIRRLGIGHNPIVSLEALRGNQEISYLNIEMLEIPSLNVLSTMGGLQALNISGMAVRSLALLEDVPLRELNMFGVEIDNVKDYGLLHSLEAIDMGSFFTEIARELAGLPKLRSVIASNPWNMKLKDMEMLPNLESLYFYGADCGMLDEEIIEMPNLTSLTIPNSRIRDFRWLKGMPKLKDLSIIFCECESYDGLEQAESLRQVYTSEGMAEDIRKAFPQAPWTVYP